MATPPDDKEETRAERLHRDAVEAIATLVELTVCHALRPAATPRTMPESYVGTDLADQWEATMALHRECSELADTAFRELVGRAQRFRDDWFTKIDMPHGDKLSRRVAAAYQALRITLKEWRGCKKPWPQPRSSPPDEPEWLEKHGPSAPVRHMADLEWRIAYDFLCVLDRDATRDELDVLVLSYDNIKKLGGPEDAACKMVGRIFDRKGRQVWTWRKDQTNRGTPPEQPFDVWPADTDYAHVLADAVRTVEARLYKEIGPPRTIGEALNEKLWSDDDGDCDA